MNNQIEKATVEWQQSHIEDIFQRVIGRKLIRTFSSIQTRIGFIKNEMTGFKTEPVVDNEAVSILAPSGLLVSGIVLSRLLVNPGIAGVAFVGGLAVTGLTMFKNMNTFHEHCEKTFKSTINALTKEIIITALQERYAGLVESMIKRLLNDDLMKDINNMKWKVHSMQEKHMEFESKTAILQSLLDKVNQIQAHLNTIERIEINLD